MVIVAVAVGYYLTGPGPRWRGAEVVVVEPRGSRLWVGIETCGGERRVRIVEQSADRVVVQGWIRWNTHNDCYDLGDEVVELDEPLGDRQVIDAETGDVVARGGPETAPIAG